MLPKLIAATLTVSAGVFVSAAASCPVVTSTESGLAITIKSDTAVTDGRALTLRNNQYDVSLGVPSDALHYVGIDVTSPTLTGNLRNGILYNETRGADGKATDLPPAAYINLEEQVDTTNYYIFSFANSTYQPLDDQWYLADSGDGETYNLLRNVTDGLKTGWVLCLADYDLDFGPWYSLEYFTYNGTQIVDTLHAPPTCEVVSVQAKLTDADKKC